MFQLAQRVIVSVALLAIIFSRPVAACAQEKATETNDLYFMILFSQERDALAPRFSHTYAAFVHAQLTRAAKDYQFDTHTISWLPATLDVRLLRPPEKGVNLGLKASLDQSVRLRTRISMWGPFRIKKELYDRAVAQEARLKSGKLLYKALDGAVRAEKQAVNCFHTVADIDSDRDRALLETGKAHGDTATLLVAQHLRRWIIDPGRTYDWVSGRLGLDGYSITRRNLMGEIVSR